MSPRPPPHFRTKWGYFSRFPRRTSSDMRRKWLFAHGKKACCQVEKNAPRRWPPSSTSIGLEVLLPGLVGRWPTACALTNVPAIQPGFPAPPLRAKGNRLAYGHQGRSYGDQKRLQACPLPPQYFSALEGGRASRFVRRFKKVSELS